MTTAGEDAYILVTNDVQAALGLPVSAPQIAETLLISGFWAFTEQAPLRAKLRDGDRLLVYIAGTARQHFIAAARAAGQSTMATTAERRELDRIGLSFMQFSIALKDVARIEPPVALRPLIQQLAFISNKTYYGLHLRLPVVRIPAGDYERILRGAILVPWT